jgi:hypothetical protein
MVEKNRQAREEECPIVAKRSRDVSLDVAGFSHTYGSFRLSPMATFKVPKVSDQRSLYLVKAAHG